MWANIYEQSGGLVGPTVVNRIDPLPFSFVDLHECFSGALESVSSDTMNFFRGYIEGREDHLLPRLFLEECKKSNNLEECISECFDGDAPIFGSKAGVIINGVLQWSEHLQNIAVSQCDQLRSIYEGCYIELDLTVFIGKYGATPFGVHIDSPSHRTTLFNLGPSDKIMRVWRDNDIKEQFGNVLNVFDPNAVAAAPDEFIFASGEALVIPSTRFHVGVAESLSTNVAVVITLLTTGAIIAEEMKQIVRHIGESAAIESSLLSLSLRDIAFLGDLRRRSNKFLRYSIDPRKVSSSCLKPTTLLSFASGFRPEFTEVGEHLIMFSRGRSALISPHVAADLAIDHLEHTGAASAADLLSLLRSEGCAVIDAMKFLHFLVETRGLEANL